MDQQGSERTARASSKLKLTWHKAKVDPATIKLIFKASLPPAISIAIYQAKSVQQQYETLGYLVAISSLLGFAIMPRAKFIQSMVLNIIAVGFATAVNTLALFCVVQARIHTTPANQVGVQVYNPTASTVCAIWLVLQIYVVNVVRAARPQFNFPAILCSIFASISMTNGVAFLTMSTAITFITQLLEAFLTGFAISTGVSLVIFPMSSRQTFWKEMSAYLRVSQGTLTSLSADVKLIEHTTPLEEDQKHQKSSMTGTRTQQSQDKLLALHGKLDADLVWAKREVSYGHLKSDQVDQLWKLMRMLLLPIMGLLSMSNLVGHQKVAGRLEEDEHKCRPLLKTPNLPAMLHEKLLATAATVDDAVRHIRLTLALDKAGKRQSDAERDGEIAKAGSSGFAGHGMATANTMYSIHNTLGDWAREQGIELPSQSLEDLTGSQMGSSVVQSLGYGHEDMFFVLYFEYLLARINSTVLDLITHVDGLRREGVLDHAKLIIPGSKRLHKWIRSIWVGDHIGNDDYFTTDIDSQSLSSKEKIGKKIDPEHFPPRNRIQKIGATIRLIPEFFRSEASRYGLRVATATFTIGIICYLRDTQSFFLRQRLRWALNTVAFSMTRTTGQSFLSFTLRLLGTILAMLASYVIWYIVDGKAPGVIIFLWIWILLVFYVALKQPKLTQAAILNLVTVILIIGYELQVKAIGVERAEASGQPAYPTYELAPYRLAVVAGGLVVAFIWTIFPYPISESSELRKDVSSSLYLLSSYYRVTHELVKTRLHGGEESQRAQQLIKASHLLFSRLLQLSNSLKKSSAFSRFQIHIGGSFPREEYEELIACIRRLALWVSLASYSCASSQPGVPQDSSEASSHRVSMASFGKITSLLSLLASSLSNAQPLPASLDSVGQSHFIQRFHWDSSGGASPNAEQLPESEYRVLAAMHIVSRIINRDLAIVISYVRCVKKLVGETEVFTDSDDLSMSFAEDERKVESSQLLISFVTVGILLADRAAKREQSVAASRANVQPSTWRLQKCGRRKDKEVKKSIL